MPQAADGLALLGVLLVALAVRALAWSRTAVLFNDGPIFLALAEALRAGRVEDVLAHPQHPLYPAFVAALEALAIPPEPAAVAVAMAGGLLSIVAIFWMAWSSFGRAVAWGSAWVVALHPWAVDFSSDVMSDGLYAGLYLASFACLVELLERPAAGRALAFGSLAGLAYLTRPEGLGIAVVGGVLMAGAAVGRADERGRRLRSAAVAFVACALLAGGVRVVELRGGEGRVLTGKKSVAELLQGGPSSEAIAEDRRQRREERRSPDALPLPEGSIRSDGSASDRPARSLAGLLEATVRVVRTSLAAFRYELFAFACLGLAVAPPRARRERWSFDLVLWTTVLAYSGLLVLLVWGAGYVSRRHALAAWLPLTPYAVVGWLALWSRVRAAGGQGGSGRAGFDGASRRLGSLAPIAPIALLVVVLALAWGPRDLRERRADRALERVAAEWLRERQGPVGPVAAQKRRTAFYAGAVFVPIPAGRDGLIERQLRARGARWLVIDAAKLGDHLGLSEGIGQWLEPVHRERSGDQEILVLAIVPPPAG